MSAGVSRPSKRVNDFSIQIATVNGSGSQSANLILAKSLFRMGIPIGAANLFPSNIAGLPTWFSIRANEKGFTSRPDHYDFKVLLNSQTLIEDLKPSSGSRESLYFVNEEFRSILPAETADSQIVFIPYRDLTKDLSTSVKVRRLVQNIIYVGVMGSVLNIDLDILIESLKSVYVGKDELIPINEAALKKGHDFGKQLKDQLPCSVHSEKIPDGNKGKIFIDGNTAAGLGWIAGGCTFASWYPITPSTSLVEAFESYLPKLRKTKDGNPWAVVQAEDELSAISMALGAGWTGARAATATSGPGLSLMSEAIGLGYFAEVPVVVWDVQRVGPSTGLPTRTMQGDLSSAYHLSHGDTEHVVLLPANPEECYEFGPIAFDLAEQLQTPVIVLSDLDIGMNFHIANHFQKPTSAFQRGKVLNEKDLAKIENYGRYIDSDGDGVGYRTLPGIKDPKGAYFTRGTGHDEFALYSESGTEYKKNVTRLKRKFQTARILAPAPMIEKADIKSSIGVIAYGSTNTIIPELIEMKKKSGISIDYMRIRALPFHLSVEGFIAEHEVIYVIEQNRDGQLHSLLKIEFCEHHQRLKSILQFDGLPISAEFAFNEIQKELNQ